MSTADSNKENKMEQQTTTPTGTAPKAPVQAAQAPAKPKSYTERFIDMENTVLKMAYAINFQAQTIKDLLSRLEEMGAELERMNMVRKSVNAIMKLSEEGKMNFSLEAVAEKVEQLETQAAKDQLEKDLAEGSVTKIEAITNDLSLFEFESTVDKAYGIASVGTLDAELKKELIGKKAGDTVKNLRVVAVYQYNLETKAQEGTDGQASKEAATEKQ